MIKKILTCMLTVILLLSSITFTAFAAGASIYVTGASGKPGDTVTVSVGISGNTGFTSYGFTPYYDSNVLEYQGAGAGMTSPMSAARVGFMSAAAVNGDGTLFTMTFKIKEGAVEGSYSVGVNLDSIGMSATDVMLAGGSYGNYITVQHVCSNYWTDVSEVPATCTSEGTAAHKVCTCGLLYVNGTQVSASELVIPKKAHTLTKIGVKAATCTAAGYTGDDYCTTCKDTITKGTVIAKKAHRYGDVVGAKAATCTEQGYSGDKTCLDCNYTLKGSATQLAAHKTELVNVKAATCKDEGYTGDQKCTVCKQIVSTGKKTALAAHKTELVNVKAATCKDEGYTGD